MKNILLLFCGYIFLTLGAIGLLLPLWPTTPFVLVSVACFSSSPRIKARIMKIAFFKEHIVNYERRTGLSQKTLRFSLCWLWCMLVLSMALLQTLWALLLIPVGIAVTCHILFMAKGRRKDENK